MHKQLLEPTPHHRSKTTYNFKYIVPHNSNLKNQANSVTRIVDSQNPQSTAIWTVNSIFNTLVRGATVRLQRRAMIAVLLLGYICRRRGFRIILHYHFNQWLLISEQDELRLLLMIRTWQHKPYSCDQNIKILNWPSAHTGTKFLLQTPAT